MNFWTNKVIATAMVHKNRATCIFVITLANEGQFQSLFQCRILRRIAETFGTRGAWQSQT